MAVDHRKAIEAAGRELAAAEASRGEARDKLAATLRAARGEIDKLEMARLAGVTRVTVYRMLDETDR